MGDRTFQLLTVAALVASLFLAGCAGTARGVKQSVYRHDGTLEVSDFGRSDADAMVVIRYPAVVTQDALPVYFRSFEQNAIGGQFERGEMPATESDRIAQSIIAKSNYYVMSLYRELARGLPRDSVLLSPHVIELDANDRLTSRPLLASEQVPSVVTIDFSVYSFPDPSRMMNAPPLTFGDIVTPLFVIHSNRWARPPTHGLLLSSEALVEASWTLSQEQAGQDVDVMLNRAEQPPRPLDFVRFLDRGDMAFKGLPVKSPGESRRQVLAVEVHPLEKIRMDADLVTVLLENPNVDPFAEEFVKGAATRIVKALNTADHDRATFFDRQAALSEFDPDLGMAFLSRSGSEDLRARLQMGEALLRAERTFLSAQSAALYEGAYEGVYGDQMRQVIKAEFDMLEERRHLARVQNWSTALAIVAMAGAVYAGSDYDSSDFLHSGTFENIALITSLWAVNNAMVTHAQSKTIGSNFLAQMAPAINRQVAVQVEWMQSSEEITARDFAEFRQKTLALYQSSVRGVETEFDALCAFGHPAIDAPGTWFGPCAAGLASGSGYGILVDAKGNTIEYLGVARNGLGEGTGAMIFRPSGASGTVYYEGSFSSGKPHGVVWVEQVGRKPRVRTFVAGVDKGAADVDQLQRVQF
jgi:predicted small secreted protein